MSKFIELTLRNTRGVTINTAHIATIQTRKGGNLYGGADGSTIIAREGEVVTQIMLAGPLPGHAFIEVTESYEEVAALVGLKL